MHLTKKIGLCCLVLVGACGNKEVFIDDTCGFNVNVSPSRVELAVGDSVRVSARMIPTAPSCVSTADQRYRWRVINTTIASVELRSDSTAVVRGHAAGESQLAVESVDGKLGLVVPLIVRSR